MADKKLTPGLKLALEYGPIIAFFALYMILKDRTFMVGATEYSGFVAVTAMFIPILAIATYVQWHLTGHLSKMQIATLILVVVFGGLSIWFNDERFFKMKPTIIYLIFAGLLGASLILRRNWLELVMSEALPMRAEGWRILTLRMVALFLGLALANELVWRTMSETAWVNFKTFGLPAIMVVFFLANARLFERYGLPRDRE